MQSYNTNLIYLTIEAIPIHYFKKLLFFLSQYVYWKLQRFETNSSRSKVKVGFGELFEWICAVSSTHRYDRVSDLLSGRQTTHAAQRTAKSTLTYELGTGEVLSSLSLFASIYRHRDGGRVNGPYTASARGFPRPFPRLLTPDHVSTDYFSIELLTPDLLHSLSYLRHHALHLCSFPLCHRRCEDENLDFARFFREVSQIR